MGVNSPVSAALLSPKSPFFLRPGSRRWPFSSGTTAALFSKKFWNCSLPTLSASVSAPPSADIFLRNPLMMLVRVVSPASASAGRGVWGAASSRTGVGFGAGAGCLAGSLLRRGASLRGAAGAGCAEVRFTFCIVSSFFTFCSSGVSFLDAGRTGACFVLVARKLGRSPSRSSRMVVENRSAAGPSPALSLTSGRSSFWIGPSPVSCPAELPCGSMPILCRMASTWRSVTPVRMSRSACSLLSSLRI